MECNGNINKTFVIDSFEPTPIISACTGVYTNNIISCDSDTEINLRTTEIVINKSLTPSDLTIDLGSIGNRFRKINTISGSSTYWSSTTINTLSLDLGNDNLGNSRIITSENSIISNDTLIGGSF